MINFALSLFCTVTFCSGVPHPGGVTHVVSAVSILPISMWTCRKHQCQRPESINVNMQNSQIKAFPNSLISWRPGECSDQGAAITETVCDPVRLSLYMIFSLSLFPLFTFYFHSSQYFQFQLITETVCDPVELQLHSPSNQNPITRKITNLVIQPKINNKKATSLCNQ